MEVRNRNGGNPYSDIDSFIKDIFENEVDERANFCRKHMESLNKKNAKKIASQADERLSKTMIDLYVDGMK